MRTSLAPSKKRIRIDLFHNIRWSRYKAVVFSELHTLSHESGFDVKIFQIADTSNDRISLSSVDLSYHRYPHQLLFEGSYDKIPKIKLIFNLFSQVWNTDAKLILLPGFGEPEYWAMLLAAILRCKRRATFCDSTLLDHRQKFLKGVLKRIFLSNCHGVFGYGRRAQEYLFHHGLPQNKFYLRCQAAALPASYRVEEVVENRVKYAASRDAPRLIYVGRLSKEKRLDILIDAFAKFNATRKNSTLTLIGSGPLLPELKQRVGVLDLESSIDFAGSMNQEELAKQYARATCLVLPSQSEPWGLVVNEALHYGCPVVVSHNCGCVPELVIDGKTGFQFETNNSDDLYAKLENLVADFNDTKFSASNCLSIIQNYSPNAAAKQILEGCRGIIDK